MTQKPNAKSPPKLGRNEPCRCGSGIKYKKCCLLREQQALIEAEAQRQAALKARWEAAAERRRQLLESGTTEMLPNGSITWLPLVLSLGALGSLPGRKRRL